MSGILPVSYPSGIRYDASQVGALRMSLSTHTGPASPPSRFAQGLLDLLERVEYRPATYSEDVEEIYRLRYEAYRREGYIPENPDRRCIDALDEAPNVYKMTATVPLPVPMPT
ncbi:MAG: hypothetical protein WD017_07005, partial [Cucumibacter sp.]